MGPSEVIQTLLHIATRLDDDPRPDRRQTIWELSRVILAVEMTKKAFLLIVNSMSGVRGMTEAPLGLCVGFEPMPEQLSQLGARPEELQVISDDGSEDARPYTDFTADPLGKFIILSDSSDESLGSKQKPIIGSNIEIWRTPEGLNSYITDWLQSFD